MLQPDIVLLAGKPAGAFTEDVSAILPTARLIQYCITHIGRAVSPESANLPADYDGVGLDADVTLAS